MSGDTILFITLIAIDLILLPQIFDKNFKMIPFTTTAYFLLMCSATIGYYFNGQIGPFFAQLIGDIEWAILVCKSIGRERLSIFIETIRSGGLNLVFVRKDGKKI